MCLPCQCNEWHELHRASLKQAGNRYILIEHVSNDIDCLFEVVDFPRSGTDEAEDLRKGASIALSKTIQQEQAFLHSLSIPGRISNPERQQTQ